MGTLGRITALAAVVCALASWVPSASASTHFNPYDAHPSADFSPDGLGVWFTAYGVHGARSEQSVAPGSGFFYFEGHRELGFGNYGFAVATASAPLDEQPGSNDQSLDVNVVGGVHYDGAFLSGIPVVANDTYGIAVDYRGVHPIAYVIVAETAGGPGVVVSRTILSGVTDPLFILVYSDFYTDEVQARINPGNDLAIAPMRYDPAGVLNQAYYRGGVDLVLGWNPPPALELDSQKHVYLAGSTVHVDGFASSGGADLSAEITWNVEPDAVTGNGSTLSFTPSELGPHVVTALVTGPEGTRTERALTITIIHDGGVDLDDDGLTNDEEELAGTDPLSRDSDHDGLRDGTEVHELALDPHSADTDFDGLPDGYEIEHGLDPTLDDWALDPDGDGFDNGAEWLAGTDPQSDLDYPGRGTVLLNAADSEPSVVLSPDQLRAVFTAVGARGVRSDVSIAPSSGFYYFEGRRSGPIGEVGFGVATATAPLDTYAGANDQSFGVCALGDLHYGGAAVGSFADADEVAHYGIAIDYSSTHPVVYVVVDRATGGPVSLAPVTLSAIDTPIHVFVYGDASVVGTELSINAGADLAHEPFHYAASYVLFTAGVTSAEFLADGFGPEHRAPPREKPAQFDPVELVADAHTNKGIILAPNHLGASYNEPHKSAVRANQGMIGEFRYFETHREVPPVNIGQGLITAHAWVDPYCCVSSGPGNAPPSMSVNSLTGVWKNLVFQVDYDNSNDTYGFAVDYRGARPVVYVIIGDALVHSMTLEDVFLPLHPMLYGDGAGPVLTNTINFGTRPFRYDVLNVLAAASVDTSELVLGWGDAGKPGVGASVPSALAIASAPAVVQVGQTFVFQAVASDIDGGDISNFIHWSVDGIPVGSGANLSYTPVALGSHALLASVRDSFGSTAADGHLFLVEDVDSDGDGVLDAADGCPQDVNKTQPLICGCGVADVDSDTDGTLDCADGCPLDPAKIAPGACGCGVGETDTDGDGTADCHDGCPLDAQKTAPGSCGCGVSDADRDGDGTLDCADGCPDDASKQHPGTCGCGISDADTDGDGTVDCEDGCPLDPAKTAPGGCGCGVADADHDLDGVPDCADGCPFDASKVAPGACGCGVSDQDTDGDGTPDCHDACPSDPAKTVPGDCGCGVADVDTDRDAVPDCHDNCPTTANRRQLDTDHDGIGDACDNCVRISNFDQADCDGDTVGDRCEILHGAPDCNGNNVPDDCDITAHTSLDVDLDGVPDECQAEGGTPFCFGDGTGTPCPCDNSGTLGRGCANSMFAEGALLSATGHASVMADTLVFYGSDLVTSSAMFLQGTARVPDVHGLGVALGDGLLCTGGALVRLGTHRVLANAASYPDPRFGDAPVSVRGLIPAAGTTRFYQVRYRNLAPYCGPETFNYTNAIAVIWVP